MPSFTSSTLLLVIGIIEFLLGSATLTFPLPSGWRPPPGPPALAAIGGAALVVVGGAALLIQTLPRRLSAGWRAVAHLVAAFPLLAAGWAAVQMEAVPALVTYGALGLFTLAGGLVRSRAPEDPERRVELFPLAVSLSEAAVGALLLAAPGAFRPPAYADLLGVRTVVGPLLLVGGAAGLASALLRPLLFRLLAALIAAGPLVLLAVSISRAQGFWAGVLVYPMLAGLLIAHPWLEASATARRREDAERPAAVTFERTVEAAVWTAIMLIVLGAQALPETGRPALTVLALILTLFTLVWFRLPPAPDERTRTLWGTVVYTVAIAALVRLTGGLDSPLFLLFFLPLMAVAWALRPRTIAIPAGLTLAALLVELILALARGGGMEAIWTAIFQGGGLLLVAVFGYLLATRAARQRALVRQEKEKLETIVAAMEEALIVLDPGGRIQFSNRAAERVLHTPAAEALGRPLADLLVVMREDGLPLDDEAHPVARALREARPVRQRVLISGGGADPVPAAFTATPLRGAEGRPPAVVCSLQDVAAEVEMERMREDFFNIASHEIRTPLTVIKGHVELILEGALGPLTDRSRHVLTEIHSATGRLIRLVNDFLDAARLDQGRITVQLDRGSLPALVEQAIATLSSDAERKGVTITYRQEGGAPPPVLMDAEKALQILMNLLDNAIKFTPRGGIEIWHDVADGQVATYVRDTGVGIRPEHRHRLFERFSQVDRGLRREAGGSGLGLYICRRLAERMRGTVALVDSAPDQGSTFVLMLPGVPASIRAGASRRG